MGHTDTTSHDDAATLGYEDDLRRPKHKPGLMRHVFQGTGQISQIFIILMENRRGAPCVLARGLDSNAEKDQTSHFQSGQVLVVVHFERQSYIYYIR